VAATSQLTGTPSPFQVQGSTVYAFLSGNQPIVLSNVCPHEGCSVNWNPARSQFVCPCHGSVFDGKGQFVSGPAGAPLPNLHAQVQNGDVFVQTT
jgi:Rieske Fe-S protein